MSTHEQSILLWDGTKSSPSEQPSIPNSYLGTDSLGEFGWHSVTAAQSAQDGPRYIYDSSLPASSANNFKSWAEVVTAIGSGQPAPEVMLSKLGSQVAQSANFRLGSISAVNRATGSCSLALSSSATLECLSVIKDGALLTVTPSSAPSLTYALSLAPPVFVVGDGAAFRNDSLISAPFQDLPDAMAYLSARGAKHIR